MNKAIFLDRDGIINLERGEYTFREEDFEILPNIFSYIKHWNNLGFKVIIITNQGGIAKSIYSVQEFIFLNNYLNALATKNNAIISDIFYCPHHPDFGKCLCRKPQNLLFEKAIAKHQIDPLKSYMIGDKDRDIIPAESLGIKSFLVEANSDLKKLLPLLV